MPTWASAVDWSALTADSLYLCQSRTILSPTNVRGRLGAVHGALLGSFILTTINVGANQPNKEPRYEGNVATTSADTRSG